MVSPRGCTGAAFYVVVMDDPGHPAEGVKEWVVGVPKKTGFMASCKTNNYLPNALTAMESQVCNTLRDGSPFPEIRQRLIRQSIRRRV